MRKDGEEGKVGEVRYAPSARKEKPPVGKRFLTNDETIYEKRRRVRHVTLIPLWEKAGKEEKVENTKQFYRKEKAGKEEVRV